MKNTLKYLKAFLFIWLIAFLIQLALVVAIVGSLLIANQIIN